MTILTAPPEHSAAHPLRGWSTADWGRTVEITAWAGLSALCLFAAAGSPEALLAHAGRCLSGQQGLESVTFVLGHCAWCWGGLAAGALAAARILSPHQQGPAPLAPSA